MVARLPMTGRVTTAEPEHFDVLVIGAGLSGIGAAWHLQTLCPDRSYAILEARDAIGGTWDLFRYPGIRSDSDMYTLGYRFKPWSDPKAIADGPSIKAYIEETARENGIDEKIRFQHRMTRAEWSSGDARWTVTAEAGAERRTAFFGQVLAELARAIHDGAKVRAFHAWSLLDNFEWTDGYSQRYGLTYVDYRDQQRTVKDSGKWYSQVASTNRLPA